MVRNRFRSMLFAAAATGAVALTLGSTCLAQPAPNAQWNALFDRMLRLEAEVRQLRGGPGLPPGGYPGSPPAGDLSLRIASIEDQLRHLTAQMQELGQQLRQMQDRSQPFDGAAARRKTGGFAPGPAPLAPGPAPPAPPPGQSGFAQRLPGAGPDDGGAVAGAFPDEPQPGAPPQQRAPGPRSLGTIPQSAMTGGGAAAPLPGAGFQGGMPSGGMPESVETRSLDGAALPGQADTPQMLYEQSFENYSRRDFDKAESGFRTFLARHAAHELAGNAQYWLGETYYNKGDLKQAAQEFLKGYQGYPRSKKAPDSLLKLGVTLKKLGQGAQACATFGQVKTQFPDAKTAVQRADQESQRAGC